MRSRLAVASLALIAATVLGSGRPVRQAADPVAPAAPSLHPYRTVITTSVTLNQKTQQFSTARSARIDFSVKDHNGRAVVTHAAISEVLDESGRNIARPPGNVESPREHAERLFRTLHRSPHPATSSRVSLISLPARITAIKGRVHGLIADELTTRELPMTPMKNPVEIAPGVTFLLTEAVTRNRTLAVSYEVRIRRNPGEGAGLEPVFAAIELTGPRGEQHAPTIPEKRVTLADEHVLVAREFRVPLRDGPLPTLKTRVYHGLRRLEAGFEVGPIDVVTEPVVPVKGE